MMTKDDMRDLLLGKAIRYLGDKYVKSRKFKYWELINAVDYIVNVNIQYESYDMDGMLKLLSKYCRELKGE